MRMVPPRSDARQVRPQACIIPTRQTRYMAAQMLAALDYEGGFDVTLRLLPQLDPEQIPALVGVLLNTGRLGGRPPIRSTLFKDAERRRLHARYVSGDRSPETVDGEREYQRLHKRARRAA